MHNQIVGRNLMCVEQTINDQQGKGLGYVVKVDCPRIFEVGCNTCYVLIE